MAKRKLPEQGLGFRIWGSGRKVSNVVAHRNLCCKAKKEFQVHISETILTNTHTDIFMYMLHVTCNVM